MPAYLVIHPRGQKKDDVLLEADDLTLVIHAGWAVFSDTRGVCLAVPSGQGASIQRIDKDQQPQEDHAEGA